MKIIKNPNIDVYNEITQAVKDNNGFCPCELVQIEDTKCPCKTFREQTTEGYCHCERFVKKQDEE